MEAGNLEKSLRETTAYFQVFNYFLKIEEAYLFLHTKIPVSLSAIRDFLTSKKLLKNNYILFLLENNQKTKKRKKNRIRKIYEQEKKIQISLKKIESAKKIANALSRLPLIKLIAISGNLAMMNADENDDIDIFLISSRNTAWGTRLIISLILIFLRKKRMFQDKQVKDKICLNFIVDENNLSLIKQNLYTAHEIAQMKVIFNKNQTYENFIMKNEWIKNYLANFWASQELLKQETLFDEEESLMEKITLLIFRIFEPLFRFIQIQYMKKKITQEIVRKELMMFHPRDYSKEIMKKYRSLLRKL